MLSILGIRVVPLVLLLDKDLVIRRHPLFRLYSLNVLDIHFLELVFFELLFSVDHLSGALFLLLLQLFVKVVQE